MAAVAHTSGVNNLCHNFHPLSYVYCLDDKMFPLELQKALVAASGVAHVDEHHISSGHSPFLSQPEKVVEIIQEMVATDEKSRENDQEQTLK